MRRFLVPLKRWLDQRIEIQMDLRVADDPGKASSETGSSLIPFAKRNGDLKLFASIVSDLDGRAHDLEFSLSRGAAFELRDNLNAILEDEPEIPVPHTSTFAAISDVAEALKDSLRPGGAAFAEALDLRLKARGGAHANQVFVNAFAGPFAHPKPIWPQAMRTDAASRGREERPDNGTGA